MLAETAQWLLTLMIQRYRILWDLHSMSSHPFTRIYISQWIELHLANAKGEIGKAFNFFADFFCFLVWNDIL
jgi:hypothetical protein